jgi:hypothetical protein
MEAKGSSSKNITVVQRAQKKFKEHNSCRNITVVLQRT